MKLSQKAQTEKAKIDYQNSRNNLLWLSGLKCKQQVQFLSVDPTA